MIYSAGAVEYTDCISAENKTHHHHHNECPGFDSKQSGVNSVLLEIGGMRSTASLPSRPGPLWPGVVAPESSYLWVK